MIQNHKTDLKVHKRVLGQFVATSLEMVFSEKPKLSLEWQGTESKNVEIQIKRTPTKLNVKTVLSNKIGEGARSRNPAVTSSKTISGITIKEILKE